MVTLAVLRSRRGLRRGVGIWGWGCTSDLVTYCGQKESQSLTVMSLGPSSLSPLLRSLPEMPPLDISLLNFYYLFLILSCQLENVQRSSELLNLPHTCLRDWANFLKLASAVKGKNWTRWFPKSSWALGFEVNFLVSPTFRLSLSVALWPNCQGPQTHCSCCLPSAWNTSLVAAPQVLQGPQSLSSNFLPFCIPQRFVLPTYHLSFFA